METRLQSKRRKAATCSETGRNTPAYFTVGGDGFSDFGIVVAPPKSFKHGANNIKRNQQSMSN